jgi:hypothetical protein
VVGSGMAVRRESLVSASCSFSLRFGCGLPPMTPSLDLGFGEGMGDRETSRVGWNSGSGVGVGVFSFFLPPMVPRRPALFGAGEARVLLGDLSIDTGRSPEGDFRSGGVLDSCGLGAALAPPIFPSLFFEDCGDVLRSGGRCRGSFCSSS